jgi:hypothetical protein
MKKKLYMLFAVLLSVGTASLYAGSWENYSNITQVTDAAPLGDHVWATCKGGVIDFNNADNSKIIYKKGDAGLPSASIEQVAVNPADNTIWVGTYDAGIVKWTGTNFITYPFPDVMSLYRMKFDSFGKIWIQANTGMYSFDCTSHEYTFINSLAGVGWSFDAWDFDITPDNHVLIFTGTNCLVIDAASNAVLDSFPASTSPIVLFCTPSSVRIYAVDENAYLIDNGGSIEFEFKDGSFDTATTGLPEFAYINTITRGADNELYSLVNSNSIYKLSDFEWTFIGNTDVYTCDNLVYADVNDFFLNQNPYYSVPTLIHTDITDASIYDTQQFNFTSNKIDGVVQDNDHNILIASANKIYSYDQADNDWTYMLDVPAIYGSMYGLSYVNGNIYAVDYGNLLEYYDGASWTHIPLAAGYTSIYIYDYDVTATGIIYFVNDEGLFKYESGITTNLLPGGGVFNPFLAVKYDAARNCIWLGRLDRVIKYDFVTQDVINSTDVPAMAEGPAIQEIAIDAENNVWFGANNNKAYKYDGTDWQDFTLGHDGDFITQFAFNGTKTYFGLTAAAGGVYVYDTADDSWTFLNSSEDSTIISNSVNQLLVDADANLWIAHADAGISRYTEATEPDVINTPQHIQAIHIFPNPASDYITLNVSPASDAQIQLTDMSGRVVMNMNHYTDKIDVSKLSTGIYQIVIRENESGNIYTSTLSIIR